MFQCDSHPTMTTIALIIVAFSQRRMEMGDVWEAESFLNTMCPTTTGIGAVWVAESFRVFFKPSRERPYV